MLSLPACLILTYVAAVEHILQKIENHRKISVVVISGELVPEVWSSLNTDWRPEWVTLSDVVNITIMICSVICTGFSSIISLDLKVIIQLEASFINLAIVSSFLIWSTFIAPSYFLKSVFTSSCNFFLFSIAFSLELMIKEGTKTDSSTMRMRRATIFFLLLCDFHDFQPRATVGWHKAMVTLLTNKGTRIERNKIMVIYH